MQIKIFDGDYNKSKFYSIMGKYFAEPKYKKIMPYMSNKENTVWFLAYEINKLIGFGSLVENKNKIVFESSYVEDEYRKKGTWKEINKARLNYSKDKNKVIEVITKEEYLKEYWAKQGFYEFRKNGRYIYLRKDVDKNEKN